MPKNNASKTNSSIFHFIKQSLAGGHHDFTEGSLRKAVFLLAIPMILEMMMESIFALVDIFFVSKLGSNATTTVGLTESVMAIVYSMAFGLGMAITANVARRVGEKNYDEASKVASQSILLGIAVSAVISTIGFFFAKEILTAMGANESIIEHGITYTTMMFTCNIVIILLHLMNGIFRGAGDAALAMKSLWIANIANIILCPVCIHFWGLTGAAIATTTGRGIGVCFQMYKLFGGNALLHLKRAYFKPDGVILTALSKLATTATLQFIIGSASWIAMTRFMTAYGNDAVAGYTIAIRYIVFFILPAFGLSNAAATLVGQNLGAKKPKRAEQSVWLTAKYNAAFMAFVTVLFLCGGEFFIRIITSNNEAIRVGSLALRVISLGYVFYGIGMVMMNAYNGAGDSKTTTMVYFFWYWLFQIPLAWVMCNIWHLGPKGIFIAIVVTETLITLHTMYLFKLGKWKKVVV